jgi:excisionase family DNA binding protein
MQEDKLANNERLHSLNTVADRLSVSIWTIRKWVQDGKLASLRLGARRLVKESEVQRAITEGLRDAA